MIEPAPGFVGRVEQLDTARRSLAGTATHGLFVHGAPGSGTTAFVQEIEASLGDDVAVLHTRGFAGSAGIPYGAVMPLLRDGDVDPDRPLHALRSVVEHLVTAGGAQAVVLVVHNAQHVDPASALVLATLAGRPRFSLVVAADSVTGVPRDIAVLVREGALVPIEIPAFTREEVAQYAAGRFGAALPARTVADLWWASRGQVRSLSALAGHVGGQGVGALDDVRRWTIRRSPTLEAALPTAHAALAPDEHKLLEILALADGLTLGHVAKIADPAVLEAVLDTGLARVEEMGPQKVRVVNPVVAAAVRGLGGAGHRLNLLAATFPDGEPDDPELALAYGRWAASCGVGLTVPSALAAARAALDGSDADAALAVLEAVPVAARTRGHQLTRGVALVLAGRPSDGAAALRSVPRLAEGDDDIAEAVAWMLGACPDLLLGDGAPGAGTVARLLLDLLPVARWQRGTARRAAVAACVGLASGDAVAALGPLRAELDRLPAEDATKAWRGALAWRLVEAGAVTGADVPEDARVVAAEVRASTDTRTHGRLSTGLLAVLAGEWVEENAPEDAVPDADSAALTDLLSGLADVRAGRPRAATALLVPLLPTLLGRDVAGALPVALAGAACAAALDGDVVAARAALAALRTCPTTGRWFPRRVAAMLAGVAGVALGDADAVGDLVRAGGDDLAAGRYLLAGHALLEAALAGATDVAASLAEVAGRVDGPLGVSVLAVVEGLRSDSAVPLLTAAARLEADGRAEQARRLAVRAETMAVAAGDDGALRLARTIQVRCGLRNGVGRNGAPRSPALTRREREVSALVAQDLNNQQIAERLHLSVRTVEGHVSRVYTKLGVVTRGEIAALLR